VRVWASMAAVIRVAATSRLGGTPPAAGAPRAEGPSEPACAGDEHSEFQANCTPSSPRTGAAPASWPTRCRPPKWLPYFARSKSSKSGGGRRDSIIAKSLGILREMRAGSLLATPTRP
jgi:hypothetical protein